MDRAVRATTATTDGASWSRQLRRRDYLVIRPEDGSSIRDQLAMTLARSFYGAGHIYDASTEKVIDARWREWREQADAVLAAFTVSPPPPIDAARSAKEGG